MKAQTAIVQALVAGQRAETGEYLGFVKIDWEKFLPFFRDSDSWPKMNTVGYNEQRKFAVTLFGELWGPALEVLLRDISEKLGQRYVCLPDPVFRMNTDTTEVKRNTREGHIHVDGCAPKGVKSVVVYATAGEITWLGSRLDMSTCMARYHNGEVTAEEVCALFMAVKDHDIEARRHNRRVHDLPNVVVPGNYVVFDQNARLHATAAAADNDARSVHSRHRIKNCLLNSALPCVQDHFLSYGMPGRRALRPM